MHEQVSERTGFLFEADLDDVDPITARVTAFEEARQVDKLIMIASESAAPPAVRQALASVFTDLYAEGYPAAHTFREPEALIGDVDYQLAYHERYGDRRYYKGTEFADVVEALAQRRIRQLFAPNRHPHNPAQLGPDQIQANVQPLSGANANTAVYLALLQPGDTILGLDLAQGGHLTHGSPANLSGKLFKVVAYGVDPATGRIDYDQVERLARDHNPRMIVTGASAYPWGIDFVRMRQICDSLPRKAYLLADVSHPAGLVVAGLFPNPVGVADVTTFTTHKTLIGPRAAVVLTTNETLARRIDRAVFPGLQGGPHMNTIAALAVAFKIAESPEFLELQRQIVRNARALAETLERRGLKLAYGGTETHLLLVDLKPIPQKSGVVLNGDVAARLLDLVGVVCNKNTIAGDVSPIYPTGIRLGTPWITQRGLTADDMRILGNVIADVLLGAVTFPYFARDEAAARGKVPLEVLKRAQREIADLIAQRTVGPAHPDDWPAAHRPEPPTLDGRRLVGLTGRRVRSFLDQATGAEIWGLDVGEATPAAVHHASGELLGTLGVLRREADAFGLDRFAVAIEPERYDETIWWLDALSNGLVLFDAADPWAKIDGPVAVTTAPEPLAASEAETLRRALAKGPSDPKLDKPYFVGQRALAGRAGARAARPEWTPPDAVDQVTSAIATDSGQESAPDGWTMPLRYGDAAAELKALTDAVGLVDETALGVLEISGPDARRFLELATTSDVAFLAGSAAQLTFLLDPRGELIAAAILYRIDGGRIDAGRLDDVRFLLTTPPARAAAARAWLTEAAAGRCLVGHDVPQRALPGRVQVRDLRNASDATGRVVLGLIGPSAPAVLRALADTPEDRRKIGRIRRFTHATARLAGTPVLVARTGHTGATHGYELFVPPSAARALWDAALARGADQGIRPIGWSAWHAAGVAAGLSSWGQELGGPHHVSPIEAGYGAEVAAHKPFFVGRWPLITRPYPPARAIARFRVADGASAMPAVGDPLVDSSGICVGVVTSDSSLATPAVGLALVDGGSAPVGEKIQVIARAGEQTIPEIGQPLVLEEREHPVVTVEILPRFPK